MNAGAVILSLMTCVALLAVSSASAEQAAKADDRTALNPLDLALPETLESGGPVERSTVAIGGYSPVSYFEKHRAERGNPAFSATYAGAVYYLASAEQLAKFEAAPEKYVPVFAQFCAYSLTLGRKVSIDPTRFKIVDGQLLLFHNSAELDALPQWNAAPDEAELLRNAHRQYTLLRFK